MKLADEIDALTAANRAKANPEAAAVYKNAAEAVAALGITEVALGVGDQAPMFELPNAVGDKVALGDLLANGPVIVSFYRGSWCPYCNLELNALQRELENAHAAGVQLVAISPNHPDESMTMVEKHDLAYPVLSDAENTVAKQFNIVFEMDEGLVEFYKGIGRRVDEMNGSENWELPVPATYVIATDGSIQFAYVNLNHRERAEPSEVVAAAAALTG